MRKQYTLKLLTSIYMLRGLAFYLFVLFIGYLIAFWIETNKNETFNPKTLNAFFLFIGLVVLVAPVLLIHIAYLYYDWGTKILIDYESKQIFIEKKGSSFNYNFSELKEIENIFCSTIFNDSVNNVVPYGSYHYYVLTFSDGKSFFCTCLTGIFFERELVNKVKEAPSIFPL